MTNAEIAAALDELGVLYELDGAVKYRVLAYGTAAKAIRESPVSVAELAAAGRATEIPGVGKTLAEKIDALLETGEIPAAVKLKAKFPPTLVEVTRVPGVGAKTARRLFDELGVATLEDLRAAAEGERIREMKGLGPKAEENVLAGLERLGEPGEGTRPRAALDGAADRRGAGAALREHPAADRVEVAGSVRRWAETCKDIDLIATAERAAGARRAPRRQPADRRGRQTGPQRRAGADPERDLGRPADRRAGGLRQPAAALHRLGRRTTCSCARTRSPAASPSPSTASPRPRAARSSSAPSEEAVYERLGYAYIEPELREGRGELKAAREGKLPELVSLDDIRGDLHSHTTLSDGRNTLEEMAEAGRERGYAYMAITDHSASHGFGDHVTAERLWERIDEVADWNKGKRGFRLLAGSEVNIGLDGSLDYPEDLLDGARLGRRQRPHLLLDLREGDDGAGAGGDREPARRLHRPPHRPPDRPPRALRDRRRGRGRGGGAHRHDDRDQRQPQPPRPLRAPRPPGRRGRA